VSLLLTSLESANSELAAVRAKYAADNCLVPADTAVAVTTCDNLTVWQAAAMLGGFFTLMQAHASKAAGWVEGGSFTCEAHIANIDGQARRCLTMPTTQLNPVFQTQIACSTLALPWALLCPFQSS
jgi:hypothetical protein